MCIIKLSLTIRRVAIGVIPRLGRMRVVTTYNFKKYVAIMLCANNDQSIVQNTVMEGSQFWSDTQYAPSR